jgi:hypothetical protein
LQEKLSEGQKKQLQAHVTEQLGKLDTAMPAWKDKKVRDADFTRMKAWGEKNGISNEEMGALTDHRALVAIHKAALYDELMAKTPKKPVQQSSKVKTATPGSQATRPGSSKAQKVTADKNRLAKTGNVRDAAALLENFL